MGCDIHVFLEEKKGDEWVFIEEYDWDRWYDTFSLLCGVRGYYKCIPMCPDKRRMPDDVSKEVWNEYERGDYHSPCYIMKSDMDNYKYYDTVFPDERGNEDRTPRDIINEGGAWDDIKALKDNQRFVFFFDN